MPGTNGGTGRPYYFRCAACRRKHGTAEYLGRSPETRGMGHVRRVELTGRRRELKPGRSGSRNSGAAREYRCRDCGHVGWSRHVELERKEADR